MKIGKLQECESEEIAGRTVGCEDGGDELETEPRL